MNSPVSFADLKRAAVEQSRRKLSQIELLIHQFSLHAAELEGVIAAEEARVGIFDPKHFAYPCYAKAAGQRRDNLRSSIEDLKQQLPQMRVDHNDALAELTKIEVFGEGERTFDVPCDQAGSGHERVLSIGARSHQAREHRAISRH
jgi:flagellar FliJ protein